MTQRQAGSGLSHQDRFGFSSLGNACRGDGGSHEEVVVPADPHFRLPRMDCRLPGKATHARYRVSIHVLSHMWIQSVSVVSRDPDAGLPLSCPRPDTVATSRTCTAPTVACPQSRSGSIDIAVFPFGRPSAPNGPNVASLAPAAEAATTCGGERAPAGPMRSSPDARKTISGNLCPGTSSSHQCDMPGEAFAKPVAL